ncbi:methyl-accepting chemotaxis protein [Stutzerimonas stutzeri]|jgi:methyl-accepting chemotaxis protein|uniref:methyl-accepting chemotaxis protein n=2 Tax=Stutzerimonas stutzeri TaxID=316 RepID=UPI0009A2D01C|nr:methyl-accepting chemotaxis protein [Stutzerimonas stutzeri]MPS58100.1 methyl-accepting chemotaxis protein [Pseudomonas sp.]AVX11989.1 methyl-accepting chemotaxis protein [Stutzerimonas stutzeri]MBH3356493.1 methyl-accepting chemotaxis protein [Stutzerimonas stutzeri]OPG84694.1 chemotaxis protein [Stutzerimonas stutzeri]GBC55443.1 chemotactic transducer [Stutzerimonas stutzeri]
MPKHLKFSHKILLAASLIVIATFSLFTLFNDYLQRNAIRDNLDSYLNEMGDVTAHNIQNWLSGRLVLLESVAQTIARDSATDQVEALVKQPALSSTFAFSYLGRADGEFIVYPRFELPAGYDPRQRPWYKDAVAAGRTTLTEPYQDAATNELIITAATPAQALGVVGGDLSLKVLVDIINALDFNGMGHAFLVSGDGKILVHPDGSKVMKSLAELFPGHAPSLDANYSEVELDGQTRILSFSRVAGLPSVTWYVGISLDKAKAYAALDSFRTSAVVAALIAVGVILLLLGMLMRVLMRPLTDMGRAMANIAEGEGDLTRRLTVQSHDEFGELASAFNRFVERIHTSIREVSSATQQVNEVAARVLAASNSSMANSDEQASRTNSVAAAINELGAAAQEIARNAADASQQASGARHQAEDGRQVVEQNIRAMRELSAKISASCSQIEALNAKTVDIGQILEVIKGISEQTNLLALNAAIEAARAGEAGRGFAVVADEVRNLAHRTQSSAQEIQQMIEQLQVGAGASVQTMTESQRQSESSVSIADRAGERLGEVTQRIGEIDGMNQSVATATEEQTAVIESLNMDITEINTLNQQGVENLQSTLRACGDLDQQARRLKQLVDSFRI